MNICFFCGQQPATVVDTIQQPVYRLNRYVHLGIVRRFEFTKLIVPVERCATCARRQRKAKGKRKAAIAIGALIGFIIGLVIPGAFLFGAIIGGFVGYLIAIARDKKSLKKLGLKGHDPVSLATHPVLGDKLKNGWKLKKP